MTQKRILRTLTAGLMVLTLSLTPVHAVKTTYSDVDEAVWYAPPIVFCQQHELMDGISGSVFLPNALMTRATLAEALYRLEGSPAAEPENEEAEGQPEEAGAEDAGEDGLPFSDVPADHPNFTAICWAKESGAVGGYPDGRFGPEDPITREQIAVLLWTDQGRPEGSPAAPYSDWDAVSDWAAPAVEWASRVKLMQGTPENRFLPLENTTRAEGAIIISS